MRIHQISVLRSVRRITITVEMPDPDRYLTSQVPLLPRNLFRLMPEMADHTCHNDDGISFRDECRRTEIPHLFEHLVLELQGRVENVGPLRGETEWDWRIDPRGFFTVHVDYDNELLVFGAIKLAERMILALDGKQIDEIDLPFEIDRLREVARIGRELEAPSLAYSAGNGRESEDGTSPEKRQHRDWNSVSLRPGTIEPKPSAPPAPKPKRAHRRVSVSN